MVKCKYPHIFSSRGISVKYNTSISALPKGQFGKILQTAMMNNGT